MMIKFVTSFVFAIGLFSTAAAFAAGAAINDAKASCIVGEQADGYLGFKSSGATELTREVNEVNLQRRALYARLAQEKGVSVAATAQLTAERLINQAPTGHCYRDGNGTWQRKS